jgi:uncharacterized protein YcgI (DUF1989 family)
MPSTAQTAVRERIVVPAREGRGVRLTAGQTFRVVDIEGSQVGDLFAYNAADVREYHSAMHTRAVLSRLFPRVGEAFHTNRRRPILTFLADDSPGIHDMKIAPCDIYRYEQLGVTGWHASCQENCERVMAEFGFPDIVVPQSINLFMDTPGLEDSRIVWLEAKTKAGDSVTMRAEMDCYVVLSACPQDIVVINSKAPSPMVIEVLEP